MDDKTLKDALMEDDLMDDGMSLVQVSLVLKRGGASNATDKIIDEIDTELNLTIGKIRTYLREKFNLHPVQLFYGGCLLDNDEFTLANYNWTNDMSGKIEVRTAQGNQGNLIIRTGQN